MIREPLLDASKGGFKTLPFIIANEAFEKVATYGLLPNLIMYLMGSYGMKLASGSTFIYYWSAATSLAPVICAFLADSYVGRFWMIGFGSIISLLGMILLWLTAVIPGARPCNKSNFECVSPNFFQLTLLASSFGIMSIGAGGIRSSSLAFGTDQLFKEDSNFGNAGILERFFNWYNVAASVSIVAALTFVVYIQDNFGWTLGFGVPVLLMLLSVLSFFLASHLYIKVKAEAESPIVFAQVFMASWKKRHLHVSERQHGLYHRKNGSRLILPSDKLRFLNRACIIENAEEELTPDGKAIDPWSLCSINQVEQLKALIKVIPIWSTGVIMSVTSSGNSFGVIIIKSMDRHITSNFEIPAGSFGTFTIISIILWIAIYDQAVIPLATIIMRKPAQLSARTRIGIGILLSLVSMIMSAVVENIRRETAIKEGFSDDPKGVTDMSALWLLPHHLFSGMAEAFFIIGQNEFFYSELPKSMSSVATNLSGIGMCVGSLFASWIMNSVDNMTSRGGKESWVSSNINKAHFDYYYGLLSGLCFINFLYYLLCNKVYGPSSEEQDNRLWDSEIIVDE